MMEADEKEIRLIVQNELLGIIQEAQETLLKKDPTGMGRKAFESLSALIRRRQANFKQDQE